MDPFDERDDGKIGWKEFNKEANSPFLPFNFGGTFSWKRGEFNDEACSNTVILAEHFVLMVSSNKRLKALSH